MTIERHSALQGHYNVGKTGILGPDGSVGVILEEVPNLEMHQVAAWANTLDKVGRKAADSVGADSAPGPCQSEFGSSGSILRIEPLKWWLHGAGASLLELNPEDGAAMDISHSRTQIRITGARAEEFLNRFLPLDFRQGAFPEGSVASSFIHHVGVTLWRSKEGYELFIPRGFALAIWEGLVEVAQQFGLEIR